MNMWFQKLMRQFFFNIDKIVFGFISSVYDLLISIARTTVLSQADIVSMADRIYKLLAIFMVFKVTFSLIMYVVNPDDFSDKSKGVSKLGTNIIISLAILVLTPYIFNYAYQFQTIILEDNSLAALVFGDKQENSNFLNTGGDSMAYIAITPFFTPNVSLNSLMNCTDVNSDACFTGMEELTKENDNFTTTQLNNYKAGIQNENLGLMFRQDLAIAATSDNEDFVMDYKYLFSTVIGVIIVLLLVTFCLDIAVRSIKLAFLQLVAPIPIISYVDPKSGKDGMFKKWYQMCFKTYLSLFIRIIALYFAIYIISRLDKMSDIIDGSYITNGFIKIFIIIGALMFAKQLPKILEGLGIKLDGGFQLNPLKKIEKEALGGETKLGKGILHAPMGAVKTLGKKTIGGVDAAINGKGFKQGWNRTHGSLYNNFYKKLDEWAPDSAEARKNERLGRENIHRMDEKAKRGEQVYRDAQGDDKNLKFSAPYRASYDAMNKAKGEMYAAEAKKTAQIAAVEEQMKRDMLGASTEADKLRIQEDAQKKIKDINKEAGTATKRYEVAKARHDEMKKVYTKDAMLEDAFDYYDKTASEEAKNRYKSSSSGGSSTNNTSSSTSQPTHHTIQPSSANTNLPPINPSGNSSSSSSSGNSNGGSSNSSSSGNSNGGSSNSSSSGSSNGGSSNGSSSGSTNGGSSNSSSSGSTNGGSSNSSSSGSTNGGSSNSSSSGSSNGGSSNGSSSGSSNGGSSNGSSSGSSNGGSSNGSSSGSSNGGSSSGSSSGSSNGGSSNGSSTGNSNGGSSSSYSTPSNTVQNQTNSNNNTGYNSPVNTPVAHNIVTPGGNGQANSIFSNAQRNMDASRNINTPSVTISNPHVDTSNNMLNQIQTANAELEIRIKKVQLQNRILEINNEIQRLSNLKTNTTDGNVFTDCANKIKALERERTNLVEEYNRM